MSISEPAPTAGPVVVLADVVAAVRDLAQVLWSAGRTTSWSRSSGLVQQATSALAAVEAGAVVEADTRNLAQDTLGYGSTGDWVTHLAGLRKGEGKRRVRHAHALCGPLTRTRRGIGGGTSPRPRPR